MIEPATLLGGAPLTQGTGDADALPRCATSFHKAVTFQLVTTCPAPDAAPGRCTAHSWPSLPSLLVEQRAAPDRALTNLPEATLRQPPGYGKRDSLDSRASQNVGHRALGGVLEGRHLRSLSGSVEQFPQVIVGEFYGPKMALGGEIETILPGERPLQPGGAVIGGGTQPESTVLRGVTRSGLLASFPPAGRGAAGTGVS